MMAVRRTLVAALTVLCTSVMAETPAWFAVQGHNEFRRQWVPVTEASQWDGLGPLFNARSCMGCHYGTALSGRMVTAGNGRIAARGLVLRLGRADGTPDPLYGHQMQTQGVQGVKPEGTLEVQADPAAPVGYRIDQTLFHGPIAPDIAVSARLAPALQGRAAIDRVDSAAIVAGAAHQAASGGPVRGTVRLLRNGTVGRYGFKAEYPDLATQIAHAFRIEMGISSVSEPDSNGDCTRMQPHCQSEPQGGDLARDGAEVSLREISQIIAFLDSRPAPAQKGADRRGNDVFERSGCAYCHVRSLPALGGGEVVLYSDLLLHDMGPSFGDGLGAPGISASQWRTAPLLALGKQNGRRYLHDGRAETLEFAIRLHGGEAETARQAFEGLSGPDRLALLGFLEGL
jgi:CxxC motif-containing protein (DUF1111 family)